MEEMKEVEVVFFHNSKVSLPHAEYGFTNYSNEGSSNFT